MKHRIRYKKPFSAFLVCVLLFSCLFSTQAFAESQPMSNQVAVNFDIAATPISLVISEEITASNDGTTSVLTFEPLEIENDGYIGIAIDKIVFTPNIYSTLLPDNSDFKNMDAGQSSFSLVAAYGENAAQTHDFSTDLQLVPNVVLDRNEEFCMALSGHTAPQAESVTDRNIGKFVVTISKKTAASSAAQSESESGNASAAE